MKRQVRRILMTASAWTIVVSGVCVAADDYRVLGDSAHTVLHASLMEQSRVQARDRLAKVASAVQSAESVARRREELRSWFRKTLGPFPEKTPLNPRVVGTVECDGYRIERVIYESRPKHHVTANLYVPTTGEPPFPGVLIPCGHSNNGKANTAYQSACILLARHGMAALIYDPIGQGERVQLIESKRHGTTTHTLLHVGALLVGLNTAHYRTWDGIRSLDYLAGRPEVDGERIGCSGNSGGGTMTTWLMAADDRIGAAAPSCFVTTQQRIFEKIGPQDGEQLFPFQGSSGIDHADFFTMRAPKPTLILAAEQDYFDVEGTRETFREAKAVYRMLGRPDAVDMFSYDDQHGFSKPRREAMAAWMCRHLLGKEQPVVEPELTVQKDQTVQVTRTGQVVRDFDDEVHVGQWNLRRAKSLAAEREAFRAAHDDSRFREAVRRLICLRDDRPEPRVETVGTIQRDGYYIEKLVLRVEGEVPVPALVFVPNKTDGALPAVLYVDARGKAADAAVGGPIERLVDEGRVVMSIDVRGFGETADRGSSGKYHNDEFRVAMLALHVGRPLLGQRVEDAIGALGVLAGRIEVDARRIDLVGIGRAGPVALHAAALDSRVATVEVRDSIGSWVDDVVARPLAPNLLGHAVPGALLAYDLPDLAAMLSEVKFTSSGH